MSYQYTINRHRPVFFQEGHPGRARCNHCGISVARSQPRVGWHGHFYHVNCWFADEGGREFMTVAMRVLSDEQLTEIGCEVDRSIQPWPVGARLRITTNRPRGASLSIGDIVTVVEVRGLHPDTGEHRYNVTGRGGPWAIRHSDAELAEPEPSAPEPSSDGRLRVRASAPQNWVDGVEVGDMVRVVRTTPLSERIHGFRVGEEYEVTRIDGLPGSRLFIRSPNSGSVCVFNDGVEPVERSEPEEPAPSRAPRRGGDWCASLNVGDRVRMIDSARGLHYSRNDVVEVVRGVGRAGAILRMLDGSEHGIAHSHFEEVVE